MSLHHVVTIHCDGCGHWVHGADSFGAGSTTAARRRAGWRNWRDDYGHHRHLCPNCTTTRQGEAAP